MNVPATLTIALALVWGLPVAVQAGPQEMGHIQAGCSASTNWSDAACECIAGKAGEKLTDTQQAYLAATLNEEDTTAYSSQMKPPEILEATMFMMKTGPQCQ